MKQINYQLTNTLINNLIHLEVEKALIKNSGISKSSKIKLEEQQTLQNVFHIAPLLKLDMTLKEAARFSPKSVQLNDPKALEVLSNFVQTLEYIRTQNEGTYVDINLTLIQHIHSLISNGFDETVGTRIRSNTEVENEYEQWLAFIDNTIMPNDIKKEVDITVEWYKNNITRIHPIIRIAVFTYRLIRITPFNSFNQLTIIALADFLMQK